MTHEIRERRRMLARTIPIHEAVDGDAHDATRRGNCTDRVVELVAYTVVDGLGIGVREEHGLPRRARRFVRGAVAAMRKVDADTHVVHLRDELVAEAREAAAALLEAAVAGEARLVVGQLCHAQAQRVERGYAFEARTERQDALPPHDEAGRTLGLRRDNVVGPADEAPARTGRGDRAVPLAHFLERPIVVPEHVGDGYVRSRYPAFTQGSGIAVAEVDETVDDGGARQRGTGHACSEVLQYDTTYCKTISYGLTVRVTSSRFPCRRLPCIP